MLTPHSYRQAFIREKAIADANRPVSSPTFGSFLYHVPNHQQQLGDKSGDERVIGSKDAALEKVRVHTRRLSGKFCRYTPVYTEEDMGTAILLSDQEAGAGDREGGFEEQVVKGPGEWAGRDSVTLGGSEKEGSEMDSSVSAGF
jgi:hypothetical protein